MDVTCKFAPFLIKTQIYKLISHPLSFTPRQNSPLQTTLKTLISKIRGQSRLGSIISLGSSNMIHIKKYKICSDCRGLCVMYKLLICDITSNKRFSVCEVYISIVGHYKLLLKYLYICIISTMISFSRCDQEIRKSSNMSSEHLARTFNLHKKNTL